jgi:hypothetical protein
MRVSYFIWRQQWRDIQETANEETLEDIREVIRNYKSRKDRQYNDQKKKDTRKNNDLQNTTQKTKDRSTRTPLNTEDELKSSKK